MSKKELKPEYYQMIGTNNLLFADIIKIFDKNHQTIRKWIKEKSINLNNIEVLNAINRYLKLENKGVTDLNELFVTESVEQ